MTISGHTKVFSILAQPVHHVRTPQALNALFKERCYDGVVVPIEVAPGDGIAKAFDALRAFNNWGGTLVTIPHKTAVPALCDTLTERARLAGAVNVVRRERDGSLTGELLDGIGFVRGLRDGGFDPNGKAVFLAGAGGAASAIAFALVEAGVSRLTVVNRSQPKSQELVSRLQERFPTVSFATVGTPKAHDIVINGTSLGLRDDDPLPIDPRLLEREMLVAEVIMSPAETALLCEARQRGCLVHPGGAMLKGQLTEIFSFLTA
ncbi:shikimate dehydrogenase [Mesorhizobium sp.]|uniref:shikimate dehydrogenase family protein n=1 Tax=Mesorhizobium sp. TaxID=1871066 RepID=UPI00120267EB|nr:shikimate dehydrogenase [Mesorhizobium sp.]TIV61387.1 MAG: shikimate dehydrogenase [Mesorhizobium sp.]